MKIKTISNTDIFKMAEYNMNGSPGTFENGYWIREMHTMLHTCNKVHFLPPLLSKQKSAIISEYSYSIYVVDRNATSSFKSIQPGFYRINMFH